MAHARLTHPSRPTIQFVQGQLDTDSQQQVSNIAQDIGSGQAPLAHVESRERSRDITGRVTAPARSKATGDNYLQALADYIVEMEYSIDLFEGEGYTFHDEIRDESFGAVYHSFEWSMQRGTPFEAEYTAEITVGDGVFPPRDPEIPDVTPQTGMDVMARVGGEDLPGFRQITSSRSFEIDTTALFNRNSAEENDIQPGSAVQHQIDYEGVHTGTRQERAAADAALQDLLGETQVTLETRFPGYALDGVVTNYDSDLEQDTGGNSTSYTLQFLKSREL